MRCKSDGTFRAMQCLSRYSCHCVDTQTGELIEGESFIFLTCIVHQPAAFRDVATWRP